MDEDRAARLEHDGLGLLISERRAVKSPYVERVSADLVARILTSQFNRNRSDPKSPPVMRLSARTPYDAAHGRMDVYMPGRWDTESDLVFMSPIVPTGPSPGEWAGTVVYAYFNPPAASSYLIIGNFSGYDTTMKLTGPWGTNTAYTAVTSDAGQVTALTAVNQEFEFTMSCAGTGLGYLESIEVFAV